MDFFETPLQNRPHNAWEGCQNTRNDVATYRGNFAAQTKPPFGGGGGGTRLEMGILA